nr:hypothetical protein [Tanacetum cinerariifolium]
MVSVTIQQDTSPIPPMTSPEINITVSSDSPTVHATIPISTPATEATTTTVSTTLPIPPPHEMAKYVESQEIDRKIRESVEESVSASVHQAMRAPLLARFKDLPTSDMKDILLQRMLDEDYEHSASGASGSTGASESAQEPPPPPPPSSSHRGDQSTSTAAPRSSKSAATTQFAAWTTTDVRSKPVVAPIPENLHMDEDMTADDQACSSSDEDIKDIKEKDKIRAKPDKIKSKRKAWKSPESSPTKSKPGQSQESIKEIIGQKKQDKKFKGVDLIGSRTRKMKG